MESGCHGVELPITLKIIHVYAHIGKNGFINFWQLIFLYFLMNHWLQLRPALRLTRARSRLLALEDVDNLLKRLFALRVAQDISSLEKYSSILLQFNRNSGELPSTRKFCHEVVHVGKQGFENFWLLILLYRLKNLCLQLLPGRRLTRSGLLVAATCSALSWSRFRCVC